MLKSMHGVIASSAGTSSIPWDLSNAVYSGLSFGHGSQATAAADFPIKPDGTKMYILDFDSETVYQYTLSTPWDVNTASYDSVSKDVSAQSLGNPQGLFFKTDGTKAYVINGFNDKISQYTLSSAWDLSTMSYASLDKDVTSETGQPSGVFFRSDGLKMYVSEFTNDRIYQYTLGTAWNVSTATYDSIFFSAGGQTGSPTSLFFKSDGTKLYVGASDNDKVYEYDLGTAWNVSTASYNSVFLDVSAQGTAHNGIFFKTDGSKIYCGDNTNDTIYQYDM